MNILDIDVGNTRLKWRVRNNNGVVAAGAMAHGGMEVPVDQYPWPAVERVNIAAVARSEVVRPLLQAFELQHVAQIYHAHTTAQFGSLRNSYQLPSKLGVDRWLAMVAGRARCVGGFCVIDCGSAMTVDFVDRTGMHLGGYIWPGLQLQFRALREGTSAAHLHEMAGVNDDPGKSTEDCIQHGVLRLLRAGIQTIVAQRQACEALHVFYTGGDSKLILQGLIPGAEYLPDLVLDGLQILSEAENEGVA